MIWPLEGEIFMYQNVCNFDICKKKTENWFEFWIRWCRIEKREYKQKVVCSSAICGLDIYIMEPHMGAYNEPIFKEKIFFFWKFSGKY